MSIYLLCIYGMYILLLVYLSPMCLLNVYPTICLSTSYVSVDCLFYYLSIYLLCVCWMYILLFVYLSPMCLLTVYPSKTSSGRLSKAYWHGDRVQKVGLNPTLENHRNCEGATVVYFFKPSKPSSCVSVQWLL